jgi:hypothetical protein
MRFFSLEKRMQQLCCMFLSTMKRLVFIGFLLLSGSAFGQEPDTTKTMEAKVIVSPFDSMPVVMLSDFSVSETEKAYLKKYRRMKRYVVDVYPYARMARELLEDYDSDLAMIDKKSKQKKYARKANKELKEKFKEGIMNMSVNRGKVLVKLIHRETGVVAYNIIKDYLSPTKALFWQGLGRMGGANLKLSYDPTEEDLIIEEIVRKIEAGEIEVSEEPKIKRQITKKELRRRMRLLTKEKKKAEKASKKGE